jgi:hypothetical protein
MILRITGILDFIHHPISYKTLKNTTYQKLDMLTSSNKGGDTYSVESLRKSYLSHWTNHIHITATLHMYI